MSVVSLAQASTIVDTALAKGRDGRCAPLTVAVLDAGGHLVAFKREDKSGILRFEIAFGKAWGALGMGFGSRTLAERASNTPQFFTMLAAASGGRIVTNPGGVLIRDGGGDIIGAVGQEPCPPGMKVPTHQDNATPAELNRSLLARQGLLEA